MTAAALDSLTNCQSSQGRPAASRGGLGAWVSRALALWRRRTLERRMLADLDDRALRDLGLSRWRVGQEFAKPSWRTGAPFIGRCTF